jgi:hypothetical protein
MARYEHLEIYKAAFDLTKHIEETVAKFPRYHRYTLGSEFRTLSYKAIVLIIKTNNTADKKLLLNELLITLEEMKVILHMLKEFKVFPNFASFEACVRYLDSVIRQCSGWTKSQKI